MEKTIKFTKSAGGVTTVYVEHGFTENIVITSSKIDEIGKITPACRHKDFNWDATGFQAECTSGTSTAPNLFKSGWFRTFSEAVGHIVAYSGALTE